MPHYYKRNKQRPLRFWLQWLRPERDLDIILNKVMKKMESWAENLALMEHYTIGAGVEDDSGFRKPVFYFPGQIPSLFLLLWLWSSPSWCSILRLSVRVTLIILLPGAISLPRNSGSFLHCQLEGSIMLLLGSW